MIRDAFEMTYERTSFNDATDWLFAGLSLRHAGSFVICGPLLVGVKNISSASVFAADIDGVTADGTPY